MRKSVLLILTFISIILVISCGRSGPGNQKIDPGTEYQAVFMANGQVFFGKAELGPDFVTLKDAFYIQNQVNEKKEVKSILIKRGQEWHGPQIMFLNRQQVVLIEPVAADSRVAQLIKEAKNGAAPK